MTSPAAVKPIARRERSISATPTSASSWRTCTLSAGCATGSSSDARVKERASATATKYLKCRSSMVDDDVRALARDVAQRSAVERHLLHHAQDVAQVGEVLAHRTFRGDRVASLDGAQDVPMLLQEG